MQLSHGEMVAVAHHRENRLHVMALGKLCIRTLGKAIADDALLFVVGIRSHAEGRREFFDLFLPEIAGLF